MDKLRILGIALSKMLINLSSFSRVFMGTPIKSTLNTFHSPKLYLSALATLA